ncbi:L-2-hydroxyglutarate oxidase LhgO [Okibacterium sp. HSC-33S16]|uniref:L-2-hydroxyglutarate oxidase n=1 Tax=Okibacterium sp. HSC-33S16 TaxID=2910965 RepID=UPI00209FEFF7|nr:L-2-hydroxyglutarate oxidase [Okibacterium sp. HSC-33S16]MCP2031346.1 L-2-hydroxyglutarate oxidase LhgO [Okibacterium sp. HSC-33S16]
MTERIGVIGGGIVGIAIARALTQRGDGEVTVIEKERRLALHQTGRNSGVVHAGLYYPPGSLKAQLCAIGRELTREFCAEKNLPYREVGKLVVAVTDDDRAALAVIEDRATLNGVPDLRRVTGTELREIEPHAAGVAALHSPHTAAVDYAAITEAMADDVRRAGGHILLGSEVTGIRQEPGGVRVVTPTADLRFDRLIVCAGLQSDIVARFVGASPSPKILPFRGEYWELDPARQHLVRGMIYPVPDPRFPFLGVHFTRGVYDDVHVGPNAVPALAREGYSWGRISVKDTWASLRWPGAATLAREHWRMGVKEVTASVLKSVYFQDARRFVPELEMKDLTRKTAAGVRAQAWDSGGALVDDFAVDQVGPVTLLRNAPSPAATSSMAIADYLLDNYVFARR